MFPKSKRKRPQRFHDAEIVSHAVGFLCSKRTANYLMWEATAFPVCGIWHMWKQLREWKARGFTSAGAIVQEAHREMEEAMASYVEEEEVAT